MIETEKAVGTVTMVNTVEVIKQLSDGRDSKDRKQLKSR